MAHDITPSPMSLTNVLCSGQTATPVSFMLLPTREALISLDAALNIALGMTNLPSCRTEHFSVDGSRVLMEGTMHRTRRRDRSI